jgi:hypothetical protein
MQQTNKESVNEGAELSAETLHIKGDVGAHSIIESTFLQIHGGTDPDSTQFAKYAKINKHRGVLRCHRAKIFLLEGGEVNATHVEIETAQGGTIYAQDVIIGDVKNNLKVYASNSIAIKLISGQNNIFKINYRDISILNSKIELIEDDINELNHDLKEAKRHNKAEVSNIKKKIQEHKNEQLKIKHSSQNATITIEKPLSTSNTIIFTVDEQNEIIFETEATHYAPFSLQITQDKVILLPVNQSINLH